MIRSITRLSTVTINKQQYAIPYTGAKLLAVFEQHGLPIKFDCRKGQCKACLVRVRFEDESLETLACMEEAIEGMEIDTEGLQPSTVAQPVPPMETKRVTTRKVKKTVSEIHKTHTKVFRLLSQAQEAAFDGEWEGCADYATELVEIAKNSEQSEVFLQGPNRDMIREFLAALRTSGQPRCVQLGSDLKAILSL